MNIDDIFAAAVADPESIPQIGGRRESSETPKSDIREVSEMNVGDMFRRWDGIEFVKRAHNRIENLETGKLEFCERNCKGEIIGNILGNYGPTIRQESRRYSQSKLQKSGYIPKLQRIQTVPKSWVTINGIDIPVEQCFSRKAR